MSSSHCQFDSHPPELYGSLGADASQRSGGGYLPASVESPAPVEGTSPESQNTSTYMALRDEAREPSNEYDYIPGEVVDALAATSREERRGDPGEKKRVGNDYSRSAGDTSVGSRKVMNNSMYENHDIKPLLHPTLSRSETVKEGGGVGARDCTCSTQSLVQAFFLAMTMLLAVASLGLSGLMWFGVNEDPPPTAETVSVPECSCPDNFGMLREDIEALRSALQDMNTSLAQIESELPSVGNAIPTTVDRTEELRSDINNLTHLIFSEPPIDLHLVNISHTYGCETTVNASCSLDDSSDTNCTTDFFTLNRTDYFELYSMCRYEQEPNSSGTDFTGLSATLETREDGAVRCGCLRIGEAKVSVKCQLLVTSCPLYWGLGGSEAVSVT